MKYYLWYDNGTGWYEGPYQVKAQNLAEAIDKSYLRWAAAQTMVASSFDKEYDPNRDGFQVISEGDD